MEREDAPSRDPVDPDPYTLLADSATLETDRLLRLLADYRRRHILVHLLRKGGPASLWHVCDSIIARELGINPKLVPEEREKLYLGLFHTHVPLLESREIVVYDAETDQIRLTAEADVLERVDTILSSCVSRGWGQR